MNSLKELLAVLVLPAALLSGEAPTGLDPVPLDRVPGEGVPGTVVVDDRDPAVTLNGAKGKPRKAGAEDTAHGGTVLEFNGWNKVGDGKTTLSVTPALKPGTSAVWVRFGYLRKNHHGVAGRAVVSVQTKDGERRRRIR